jgi:tetratricopeptide (TPR) repeat protein
MNLFDRIRPLFPKRGEAPDRNAASQATALIDAGNLLEDEDRLLEALQQYDSAIALEPALARAHLNRGNIFSKMLQMDAALACYETALIHKPDYAAAHYNMGNTHRAANRPQAALDAYTVACRLDPEFADAELARAEMLGMLGFHELARTSYRKALALRPDHAESHFCVSQYLLASGDFEAGWEEYEWRLQQTNADKPPPFSEPRWSGRESLQGKSILLHAEQGLGDTIQFCRYVAQVAGLGARVYLVVPPPLRSFLRNLEGVHKIVDDGHLPQFDYHCPLPSLPRAFATRLDTIPAAASYLGADADVVSAWRAKLGAKTGPRIGMVWSGNPRHVDDRNRSISLASFIKLVSPRAQFISLQKDVRAEDQSLLDASPQIVQCGVGLRDFADTAGLIAELDLIITVDTSVAHLAGAMGKPVWILLPFNPDWRWMLGRSDSPWYPSARLFRQGAMGDWETPLRRVAEQIAVWAAHKETSE